MKKVLEILAIEGHEPSLLNLKKIAESFLILKIQICKAPISSLKA